MEITSPKKRETLGSFPSYPSSDGKDMYSTKERDVLLNLLLSDFLVVVIIRYPFVIVAV